MHFQLWFSHPSVIALDKGGCKCMAYILKKAIVKIVVEFDKESSKEASKSDHDFSYC